jgi:hypothetical protein
MKNDFDTAVASAVQQKASGLVVPYASGEGRLAEVSYLAKS